MDPSFFPSALQPFEESQITLIPLKIEDPEKKELKNAKRRERYSQTRSKRARWKALVEEKEALQEELTFLRKKVKEFMQNKNKSDGEKKRKKRKA